MPESADRRPRRSAPPPPVRPLSRRVRLHRTIASVVTLLLLSSLVMLLTQRHDDRAQALARNAANAAAGASAATSPAATAATSTAAVPTSSASPSGSGTDATTPTARSSTSSPASDGRADADGSTSPDAGAQGTARVVERGKGTFTVVPVPGPVSTARGRIVRYTVEIENGLGVNSAEVAGTIRSVLFDRQGWQTKDRVRFVNVSPAQAAKGAVVNIRITLASPATTDRLCAPLRTLSKVSCWNGTRSVLNLRRWLLGIPSYGKDVARYRVYQVNHEVGHGLGHSHSNCPRAGARAPIMVQQSLNLQGCRPWPYPVGA